MNAPESIRAPAVAGTFYPRDPGELRGWVERFAAETPSAVDRRSPADSPSAVDRRSPPITPAVRGVDRRSPVDSPSVVDRRSPPIIPAVRGGDRRATARVRALIAPHAGYAYSGELAAAAYAGLGETPRRVILLGPSHYVALDKAAGCGHRAWQTPLGVTPTDTDAEARWRERGWQVPDDPAHAPEHALETHLPFLQARFPDTPFFPLLTACDDDPALAEQLDREFGVGDVVAVSSDLSHFFPDDVARETDANTAEALEAGDLDSIGSRDACGWVAVRALLRLAAHRGWQAQRVGLRTSADATGDRDRVVGYGAWWFFEAQQSRTS